MVRRRTVRRIRCDAILRKGASTPPPRARRTAQGERMAWLVRRVGISLVLVWVVASIVFLAIHLVPGDPAEMLLTQGGASPDPALVADLREQLGLNRPLYVQYADS